MKIVIDNSSGFCSGVVSAVKSAENELGKGHLYCLGDIVHNTKELQRLESDGLQVINYKKFKNLKNCSVLIRAHGEPPETYRIALENNIKLIDASCPVVLKLQENIRKSYEYIKSINGQLVIYGKKGHAEVIGLQGQTSEKIIIVSNLSDINQIDFTAPISIFAQTTRDAKEYKIICEAIKYEVKKSNKQNPPSVYIHNTICKKVINRVKELSKFASSHDMIIFVSDAKSSNGKYLFDICGQHNSNSYFVQSKEDINKDWFASKSTLGICGATSTPSWLMEEIADYIYCVLD